MRERSNPPRIEEPEAFRPRPPRSRGTLIWASLLGAALVAGALATATNLDAAKQAREIFVKPSAKLAIQTTPDGPFQVRVSSTATGESKTYDGSQAVALEPGDYFIDVVPLTRTYLPKRLKVHLSPNQLLALPVVLQPTRPEPPPPG
jgi:hypothetical protein